jgi:hypothetical protein
MTPVTTEDDAPTQPHSSGYTGFQGPYQRRSDYPAPLPEATGWHLKKEISLSVIISVIGIAVAGVTGYTDLKKDIALIQMDSVVLHKEMVVLHRADDESIERWKEDMGKLATTVDKIDGKLDRLIEKRVP